MLRPLHFVFAGRANVDGGSLHDALKPDRGARRDVGSVVDLRDLGVEEAVEAATDGVDVAPRMLDDPRAVGVEKQGEKQVFYAHELVPTALCLARGQPERDLDFGANSHVITPARPSL